ncbi:histidine kinase [Metabacillus sp. RGM 3146]|uniref:sensor histidine kinase n=1 Tax=Metabacillus sp. RGM 3146 TaxID=3401092 RepID=UPI003B9AD847
MGSSKKRFAVFPAKYGSMPYIFLIYLVMPIYSMTSFKGIKAIIGFGLIALFMVTYRQLYSSSGKKSFTWWFFLQLAIVMVLGMVYTPYNAFLGFFSSFFAGWYKKKREFSWAIAGLVTVVLVPLGFHFFELLPQDFAFFLPFICVMIVMPFGTRSINRKIDLEKQLDQANEKISELVKREERMRIARDLHDTLGHTLSLITLKSQLVSKLAVKNPEHAIKEAKEIETASRSALKQVRELVSDLRVYTISEELIQVEKILKAAGIQFSCRNKCDVKNVTTLAQNMISLCLREAVTNIVKHSQATQCEVRIADGKGGVTMEIWDDGIGFDIEKQQGNGLKGLKERLALVNGSLSFNGKSGSELTINVPAVLTPGKEAVQL